MQETPTALSGRLPGSGFPDRQNFAGPKSGAEARRISNWRCFAETADPLVVMMKMTATSMDVSISEEMACSIGDGSQLPSWVRGFGGRTMASTPAESLLGSSRERVSSRVDDRQAFCRDRVD